MNITREFVFVHLPKTGGTFVAEALRDLYAPRWAFSPLLRRWHFRIFNTAAGVLGLNAAHVEIEKHAPRRAIPAQYQHLPVLACIRNPLDWYVSNYKFQFWKTNPNYYPGLMDEPGWENLSFEQFMRLSNEVWAQALTPNVRVNPSLGRLTVLFIQYHCAQPERLLEMRADDKTLREAIREDLGGMTFLHTEQLNDELMAYLRRAGYAEERIAFIKNRAPVKPGGRRSAEDRWQKFYSPPMRADVLRRDRILFQIFPEYDLPLQA
ncbi:MAG TPA: sulfotransferase family 2 domain-containing protein [Thermoflexales bacterium]|nr:sulfotransferase family 2 domain-containing protein [Thermoflexales bacterium]HQZ98678.1 sulfotransferase family 2 domain-containing protein [Thermoflexales bacterium]